MTTTVLLLPVQVSIFAFAIWAGVYGFKRHVPADRRLWQAAGLAGGLVILLSLRLLVGALVEGGGIAYFKAAVYFPGVGILGVAVWAASYAGLISWDASGGYFQRPFTGGLLHQFLSSVAVVLALVSFQTLLFYSQPIRSTQPKIEALALVAFALQNAAAALGEEIFYRGWVLGALREHLPSRFPALLAVVLSSLIFMAQHVSPVAQLQVFVGSFVAGIMLALVFIRFGLVTAVLVHLAANLLMVGVPCFYQLLGR